MEFISFYYYFFIFILYKKIGPVGFLKFNPFDHQKIVFVPKVILLQNASQVSVHKSSILYVILKCVNAFSLKPNNDHCFQDFLWYLVKYTFETFLLILFLLVVNILKEAIIILYSVRKNALTTLIACLLVVIMT